MAAEEAEDEGPARTEVSLKVDEARQRDVGRSIIRLDNKTMSALNLRTGDIVEIEGKKVSAAIAWPGYPKDQNLGIIRIDARLRRNIGVELQERVILRKAHEKIAKSIIVSPSSIKIRTDSRFESFVKRKLLNYPVTIDDEIYISIGTSREICFKVISIHPKGICIVKESTVLHINESPMEETATGIPFITFDDIGGLRGVINQIRELVEMPLIHPELHQRVGIAPPHGILLVGPSGCGKSLLVKAAMNDFAAHWIAIDCYGIFSKYFGETEKKLRSYFIEAETHAPSIIYIDKIEALALNRDFQWEEERRITGLLVKLLDELKPNDNIFVIAETNQPDLVDAMLRRPGRFEREIVFPMPTEQDRLEIFTIHVRKMHMGDNVDLKDLAAKTPGLVGSDIAAICREAGLSAIRRKTPSFNLEEERIPIDALEGIIVTRDDFKHAISWFLRKQKPQQPPSDQVALGIVHRLLARVKSLEEKEILLSKTSPDATVVQKVQSMIEILLEKRLPPIRTGEKGTFFATKLPQVYFCEKLDGTYWLIRETTPTPQPTS